MNKVVGIGEFSISNNINDVIRTYALGSCVAVTAYNSRNNVAGMIHIALPAPLEYKNERLNPSYYAVTGIPLLIKNICEHYNCMKGELKIQIYGGARSIKTDDFFCIGFKNIKAVKQILEDMNLNISNSEIGGTFSRTLEMHVATGVVNVVLQPIII